MPIAYNVNAKRLNMQDGRGLMSIRSWELLGGGFVHQEIMTTMLLMSVVMGQLSLEEIMLPVNAAL